MKQLNLLKTLFLLCALMVGYSSAWADTVEWDLSKKTYTTGADYVTWSSDYVVMTNSSASGGTSATNYLGGDANNRTSSRFYKNNVLTITPSSGYEVSSVVFTATSEGYATALATSTWTNATAAASEKSVTVTPTNGNNFFSAVIGGTCGFTKVVVTYSTADARTPIATIGDLTPTEIETDAMGSFSVDVTAEDTYSVSYESSDDDILLMIDDIYLAGSSKGNVTVTVTITPDDAVTYKPVSKEFIVQVYDPTEKGTKWNPYTASEAKTVTSALGSNETIPNIYTTGIVSYVGTLSGSQLSYKISDDGTTANQLDIYKGKYIDNADFTDDNKVKVGDVVVIFGTLKNYNGTTPEYDSNSRIMSLKRDVKEVSAAGYATYVAADHMEFAEGDAFAVVVDGSAAKLNSVTKVAKNTPVLLKGAGIKNVSILANAPAAITTDLKVSIGSDPADAYVLANKGGKVGFYKWNGGSLTTGKVYLYAPGLSAHEYIAFDGEESGDVTGINEVAADKTFNGEFFNLAGQRVAQPTKGLYIVNGKKVIIK